MTPPFTYSLRPNTLRYSDFVVFCHGGAWDVAPPNPQTHQQKGKTAKPVRLSWPLQRTWMQSTDPWAQICTPQFQF